ncbi:MAG: hypothetical protein CMJ18_18575 [Phycisphaeraceae bacterium]|nr:hypothetical protein [Phycisphaeraceae bacterium]
MRHSTPAESIDEVFLLFSLVWLEIEEALQEVRVFEDPDVPNITHGMCPACHANFKQVVDSSDWPAFGRSIGGPLKTRDFS